MTQLCNGKPAVLGHSIFPKSSLTGALAPLEQLGTRSIGEAIFHHPSIRRGDFQYGQVKPGTPLFAQAKPYLKKNENMLWARRSLLFVEDKPILVTEIFLPEGLGLDASMPFKKKLETPS